MKLTFSVLEDHSQDTNRRWPAYMFGGRIRTSTLVLIIAFFAVWWTYDTYRPPAKPSQPPAQVVPPGFVPDPNYTWVPRSRVQQPPPTYYTPTSTPTPTPTTTEPTTSSTGPPTTTTTTPPPLFQLPVLPPPFGPGTSAPASPGMPGPAPPGSSPASPGPTPAPGPVPGLPGFGP